MTRTSDMVDPGPATGEPLAVDFVNTLSAVRGRLRDGLAEPAGLARWLARHRTALAAQAIDPAAALTRFVALRDAIRALVHAATEGAEAPAAELALLNAAAAAAPSWPVLAGDFTAREHSAAPPAEAALAAIARDAIEVLGGARREQLRACQAPGCAEYFVKDHPRREWCCAACGNRARAARHYRRHHQES